MSNAKLTSASDLTGFPVVETAPVRRVDSVDSDLDNHLTLTSSIEILRDNSYKHQHLDSYDTLMEDFDDDGNREAPKEGNKKKNKPRPTHQHFPYVDFHKPRNNSKVPTLADESDEESSDASQSEASSEEGERQGSSSKRHKKPFQLPRGGPPINNYKKGFQNNPRYRITEPKFEEEEVRQPIKHRKRGKSVLEPRQIANSNTDHQQSSYTIKEAEDVSVFPASKYTKPKRPVFDQELQRAKKGKVYQQQQFDPEHHENQRERRIRMKSRKKKPKFNIAESSDDDHKTGRKQNPEAKLLSRQQLITYESSTSDDSSDDSSSGSNASANVQHVKSKLHDHMDIRRDDDASSESGSSGDLTDSEEKGTLVPRKKRRNKRDPVYRVKGSPAPPELSDNESGSTKNSFDILLSNSNSSIGSPPPLSAASSPSVPSVRETNNESKKIEADSSNKKNDANTTEKVSSNATQVSATTEAQVKSETTPANTQKVPSQLPTSEQPSSVPQNDPRSKALPTIQIIPEKPTEEAPSKEAPSKEAPIKPVPTKPVSTQDAKAPVSINVDKPQNLDQQHKEGQNEKHVKILEPVAERPHHSHHPHHLHRPELLPPHDGYVSAEPDSLLSPLPERGKTPTLDDQLNEYIKTHPGREDDVADIETTRAYIEGTRIAVEEDSEHEFKAVQNSARPLERIVNYCRKYIVSFLNASGGTLYFGVEDDGQIKGVPFSRKGRDLLRLGIDSVTSSIRPQVDPHLVRVLMVPVESAVSASRSKNQKSSKPLAGLKFVVEIHIGQGDAPVYLTKDGSAYFRRTGSVYKMDNELIQRRRERGRPMFHGDVPALPKDFIGRKKEIEQIREYVLSRQNQKVVMVLLHGLPMTGKSTLARKLVDNFSSLWPDTHLLADLKGITHHYVNTIEAKVSVIRSVYPILQLPADKNEVNGIYQSCFTGKRAILLIENAGKIEQIKDMVPGTAKSVLILITSRRDLPIEVEFDAISVKLAALDEASATELFYSVLNRNGPEIDKELAAKLVKLCAYMPLPIRLLAASVARLPNVAAIDALIQSIQSDDSKRIEYIVGSFSTPLDGSVDDAGLPLEFLLSLSIFPSSFDAIAVSYIWGMSLSETTSILGELVESNEIDLYADKLRYIQNDLLRFLCAKKAVEIFGKEDLLKWKSLFVDYYLSLMRKCTDLYQNRRVKQGLELLGLESANFEAAISYSLEIKNWEVCAHILNALNQFIINFGTGEQRKWVKLRAPFLDIPEIVTLAGFLASSREGLVCEPPSSYPKGTKSVSTATSPEPMQAAIQSKELARLNLTLKNQTDPPTPTATAAQPNQVPTTQATTTQPPVVKQDNATDKVQSQEVAGAAPKQEPTIPQPTQTSANPLPDASISKIPITLCRLPDRDGHKSPVDVQKKLKETLQATRASEAKPTDTNPSSSTQ